jgi:indole-3-glycerol phosphate synthase
VTAAVLLLSAAHAFAPGTIPTVERSSARLFALGGLARKMKEKEIAGLKENAGGLLKLRGTKAATKAVETVLRKMPGAVSLIAEYRRKGQTMGSVEISPPTFVSREFRMSRAEVVSVLMDKTTGGCTVEDAEDIIREQALATGDFPGPAPLMWHDVIIDEVQLAQAASVGAAAVLLSLSVLGDDLPGMLTAAAEYGLESVVGVRSAEELAQFSAAAAAGGAMGGVGMVALMGFSVDDAIKLLPACPEKLVKIVFLPVYDDKQLIEAEDAWRLRDAGCTAIWASEVLFKFGVADGERCASVIRAIKSKGSVKYGRASGAYNGKGEGAKEYLGFLAM